MLRRMNVVESDETADEKDKSWNLAAAIWYVKKDEKDKSWNLAAAIWCVEKDECC